MEVVILRVSTEHNFPDHTRPWQVTYPVKTCRVMNCFVTVQAYIEKPLKHFMHWTTKNTVTHYFYRSVETYRVTTFSIPIPTKIADQKECLL